MFAFLSLPDSQNWARHLDFSYMIMHYNFSVAVLLMELMMVLEQPSLPQLLSYLAHTWTSSKMQAGHKMMSTNYNRKIVCFQMGVGAESKMCRFLSRVEISQVIKFVQSLPCIAISQVIKFVQSFSLKKRIMYD